MTRYGYHDMPENYSDIAAYDVEAECVNCHKTTVTLRENCWTDERGELVTDCMCSERN